MSLLSELYELTVGFITINSRMKKIENENTRIKDNYLSRFDDVKDRIANSQDVIMQRMNDNHKEIIDRIHNIK